MQAFLAALQDTALAVAIRQSAWMFPAIETVHVMALVLVVGTIALVDLRLLGWASRDRTAADLIERVLPATWVCFLLAAVSGALLFSSNAVNYGRNLPFLVKLCLLALAGLNMAVFHLGAHKRIADWDNLQSPPPPEARFAGAISLILWAAIVFAGRWIGFTLV